MALTEQWVSELAGGLIAIVKEISGLHERGVLKHMYGSLIRRIKLLSPLFEELEDSYEALKDEDMKGLEALQISLEHALFHLKLHNRMSKFFKVLVMHEIADKCKQVSAKIEAALNEIPYRTLDIGEDALEQIELVHAQFRRAKEKGDSPDLQLQQLQRDLCMAMEDKNPDTAILKRFSEKLQLKTLNDINHESFAFDEVIICQLNKVGERAKWTEDISSLIEKLKDYIQVNPGASIADDEKMSSPSIIPYDFQCPISCQLMADPVIVSTGQTYERSYIQKWLIAGNKTCPKTQQTLSNMALMTPNYVLKSSIAHWCESNGIELPKKQETYSFENSIVQSSVVHSSNDGRVEEMTLNDAEASEEEDNEASDDDTVITDYETSEDEYEHLEEIVEARMSEVRQQIREELQQQMFEEIKLWIQRQTQEMEERMLQLMRDEVEKLRRHFLKETSKNIAEMSQKIGAAAIQDGGDE